MRISDWSSDVCSSDLSAAALRPSHRTAASRRQRSCGTCLRGGLARVEPTQDFASQEKADVLADQLGVQRLAAGVVEGAQRRTRISAGRSEEHTSELQSLMRISYAVFCLKKKKQIHAQPTHNHTNTTTADHQKN